jgi:hypothetical protein
METMVAWLAVWMKVACACICSHWWLPASGHACTGQGAQVGLYGSSAPPILGAVRMRRGTREHRASSGPHAANTHGQ